MSVRILIADDQRAHRTLLSNVVMFLGGAFQVAKNGQEAVYLAQNEPFDIILMDLDMPELDGIAASDRILESWQGKSESPCIVAVSGHNLPEVIDLCQAVGMHGFIAKPHSSTALRLALQSVITRGSCWAHGDARRALSLGTLEKAAALGRVAFDGAAERVATDLRLLHEASALAPEEVTSLLQQAANFFCRCGFLAAQEDTEALLQALPHTALEAAKVATILEQYQRTLSAARSWLPRESAPALVAAMTR